MHGGGGLVQKVQEAASLSRRGAYKHQTTFISVSYNEPGGRNRSAPPLNSISNLLNCCRPYQSRRVSNKTRGGSFPQHKPSLFGHTMPPLHHHGVIYKTDRELGAVKITPS